MKTVSMNYFIKMLLLHYMEKYLYETISRTAKIFIPLTVGGGIRSIKDIYKILRAGADKVSINSQGFKSKNDF